jgi:phage/plasmid-like protein (TIGR03299 family)
MTVAAANRMAALDTSTGKVAVMVAGEPAWHKLGVNVAEAVSSKDALRLAGLDWQVKKQPLKYTNPVTGQEVEAPGCFGIVRQDTGAMLGDVGRIYKPIQNAEGFEMLDGILNDSGAKYEAAGSLYGGARVFMLVRLPEQAFDIGDRDHVEAYALFTNPHDGSGVAECFATSERVVCANTLRVACNAQKGGLKIRHTGDLKARVKAAQHALGIAAKEFKTFAENAEVLAGTPVPDIRHYCNDVLDDMLDVTLADMKKGADLLASVMAATEAERELAHKSFEKKIERRSEILQDMLERYESERCGFNGQRGTAWAGLNAVTESADHGKLGGRFVGGEQDKRSRRFESILTGEADEAKQLAYQKALAS